MHNCLEPEEALAAVKVPADAEWKFCSQQGGGSMVEFVAAALIVSGFWMLLELGRFVLKELSREHGAVSMSVGPGREYVERYAEAFRRLAESYQQMPGKKEHFGDEEVGHILGLAKEEVCRECSRREECWGEGYYETCRRMTGCLGSIESGAASAGQSEELADYCQQETVMEDRLRALYLQERVNLMWNNRMLEQRAAAGEQIQDTAALLSQMADRIYQIQGLREREFRRLEKELKYEKVGCRGAWFFKRDESHPELYVTMAVQDGSCIQAKDLSEIISGALGCRMVPARDCRLTVKREFDTFHYVTDTEYQMFCGISRMMKTGELVSGDNFAFWQGDCGQVVMSLADGMGTGIEACRESEKVIELLEQFLDAGFSQETAVRMINASMVLQDHMKIFSTIDLCMVDLYRGTCSMMKAGACPTFLLRGEEMEVISSQDLPAGMMQPCQYETVKRTLQPKDQIIMMTDGVMDALPQENRQERMKELILKTRSNHAREFARNLLEQVLMQQKFQARDDMTVLVGQIWEK